MHSEEEIFISETGYDLTKKDFNLPTVLCGDRVSQMTKTYADVDALQKLLEEKEKDLELAARIGQQLLEQNQHLGEKVATLEQENKEAIENLTQLKHELSFKSQLLEFYNETESAEASKAGTPVGSTASTVLERRIQKLEDENKALRDEAFQIVEDVEKTEAEEKYLVEDAIKRLAESNHQLSKVSDELLHKSEQLKDQQDELLIMEEELKNYNESNKGLYDENTELHRMIDALQSNQKELVTELADLKDNYVEVVAILKETQEQLREAQKKKEDGADVVTVFDSLAYEIDSSVARQRKSSDYFRRTFDTVRCANSKLNDSSLNSSALLSSVSSLGYQSHSSGLPSIESGNEAGNSTFNSLVLESGLGSSLCYSPGGSSTPSGSSWRLPEKLQIVKPLEGSSTLQVWSALAQPHLGNLLDKRPGVQTRVESSMGDMGITDVLSLEKSALVVTTPAVFTYVTTSSQWSQRDSTATSFSTNMSSTMSNCSLSSIQSQSPLDSKSSPIPSPCVVPTGSKHPMDSSHRHHSPSPASSTDSYLKLCETPQNSPAQSRPLSPTLMKEDDEKAQATSSNKTLKTLYAVYDTLCSKIGGLRRSSRNHEYAHAPQKYDLTTKIGRVEVSFESSRLQAPPKPGTGVLEKILLEPD